MPWNRPEDAEFRALFKKTIFSKKQLVPEQSVYQSKYYGFRRFSPDIFNEVNDKEAYKMYQDLVQRL